MNPTRLDLIRSTTIAGARKDLAIPIGEDWSQTFAMTDVLGAAVNITGWTFASEVRDSGDVLIATITGAIVSAIGGTFTLSIAKTITEALTASDALCWDCFKVDGGEYELMLYGNAEVKATVTNV